MLGYVLSNYTVSGEGTTTLSCLFSLVCVHRLPLLIIKGTGLLLLILQNFVIQPQTQMSSGVRQAIRFGLNGPQVAKSYAALVRMDC